MLGVLTLVPLLFKGDKTAKAQPSATNTQTPNTKAGSQPTGSSDSTAKSDSTSNPKDVAKTLGIGQSKSTTPDFDPFKNKKDDLLGDDLIKDKSKP